MGDVSPFVVGRIRAQATDLGAPSEPAPRVAEPARVQLWPGSEPAQGQPEHGPLFAGRARPGAAPPNPNGYPEHVLAILVVVRHDNASLLSHRVRS